MDIKSVIKAKGFTIEETAKRMGISRITLTQNMSRNPTVTTLQRIANTIGCNVGDFFHTSNDTELSALVEHNGDFYKATTIKELENIVCDIKMKKPKKINS